MVKLLTALLALAASVSALPEAIAPRAAAPPGFEVTSVGVNGSGCPSGTSSYKLSGDRGTLSLEFDSYYALSGQGIAISQGRKNCQVTLGLRVPSGYAFGVTTVNYNGYYSLSSGVTAAHTAYNYFQGEIEQSAASSTLSGPSSGPYSRSDRFESTNWSGCGGSTVVNIASSIQVRGTSGNGDTSLDVRTSQDFGFVWRRC